MTKLNIPNKIFKFQPPPEYNPGETQGILRVGRELMAANRHSKISGPVAVPLNSGDIDVVKNFRWTKSSSDSVNVTENIPRLVLRELQVVNPAFFNNINTILDQLIGSDEGVVNQVKNVFDPNRTSLGDDLANYMTRDAEVTEDGQSVDYSGTLWNKLKTWAWSNIQNTGTLLAKGVNSAEKGLERFAGDWDAIKRATSGYTRQNMRQVLKSYENIYGVIPTNFIYRLPYLQDPLKQISSSWGTDDRSGMIEFTRNKILDFVKMTTPNVGIDFAKSFQYPDTGPSHEIGFYLDNTVYDGKDATENAIANNVNFVYLLLYQNLPNRINRTALTPPVIYQAAVPGVFSYPWSFLSNININFIGTRRRFMINIGGNNTDVVIPEGYEIQLALTSLTPETKNLMYDSIAPVVTSSETRTDTEDRDPGWMNKRANYPGPPSTNNTDNDEP
jgi:hypothetical protein